MIQTESILLSTDGFGVFDFMDIDNDGDLDMFLLAMDDDYDELTMVFINDGTGIFTDNTSNYSFQTMSTYDAIHAYNAVGELVYTTHFSGSNASINLSSQPNGVYILRVDGQQAIRVVKF